MKNLTFATVALAAGLTVFAYPAASQPATEALSVMMTSVTAGNAETGRAALPGVDPVTTAAIVAPKPRTAAKGSAYDEIIARHAARHGVPVALARAVVRIESNFRPTARGRAGEIGLMQIKPATARMMGYSGSAKGLYDPETNIRWGMKYLAEAHRLGGGDTCGTILRYNAGHGAKRMNKVSAAYCAKVKRHIGGA